MTKRNPPPLHRPLIEADRKAALKFGATPSELREFKRMKDSFERKSGSSIEGGLEIFLEVKREFESSGSRRVAGLLLLSDDFHQYMRAVLDGRILDPGQNKGGLGFEANVVIARMWNAGGSEFLKSLSAACIMIMGQLSDACDSIAIKAEKGVYNYRQGDLEKLRGIVGRVESQLAK